MNLVDWIREVMSLRRARGEGTSLPSSDPVRRGLEESLRYGTTTLGEIAQPDWRPEPFVDAGRGQ